MDFQRRIDTVRDELAERDGDAAVFAGAAPSQYLSGFSSYASAGTRQWYPLVVVPRDGEACLLVSGLDRAAARETAAIPVQVADGSFSDAIQDMLVEGATVLVSDTVTAGLYSRLSESLDVTFDRVLDDIRAVKEEAEVAAIRSAVETTEAVFAETVKQIDPGMTESAVAGLVEKGMRERGGMAGFPPVVAVGSRAAHPHHAPGDTTVGKGPVLFDIGAWHDGYVADIARTIHVGSPTDRFREVYNAVREAQEAAEGALMPGADPAAVDEAARDVLAAAGYDEDYPHPTGHGVGLSVHEPPKISFSADQPLEAGNVVTLEPAVYLDGEFGVRIEDVYVLGDDGAERLTQGSRALEDHIASV
ncbi:MAG: Xaa-Pro peptidase family protein [Candidatus Nanohaloarchaea archaeon]|nr:Xaa-Pro peptidase family protein [Candidatus Nanohaloarchaea archaeon]